MATTPAGERLTTAHRAQQLAVQAGSIRDLLTIWRSVDVTRLGDTIDVFAQAAALLAGRGFDASAQAAAEYYSLFRRAELGAGVAVAQVTRPPTAQLAGSIRGAALSGIIEARRAGKSIDFAGRNGLVKAVGTFGRLVLAGGRGTIATAIRADRRALGWQRVTSGDPCPFCRMVASRGPAYKTERSAAFQSHDLCGCTPEPFYSADDVRDETLLYEREWRTAQEWARANVTRRAATSNNALNNYRQWLANGKPDPGRDGGDAGTEDSGL